MISQEEFETCDRYELMYETLEYDTSAKTFHDQEDGMMDAWGNLKVLGDSHTKAHQGAPSLFTPSEGG
jgi:hypothetical protein